MVPSLLLGVSSVLASNNVVGRTGTGNVIIALGQSADQAAKESLIKFRSMRHRNV